MHGKEVIKYPEFTGPRAPPADPISADPQDGPTQDPDHVSSCSQTLPAPSRREDKTKHILGQGSVGSSCLISSSFFLMVFTFQGENTTYTPAVRMVWNVTPTPYFLAVWVWARQ